MTRVNGLQDRRSRVRSIRATARTGEISPSPAARATSLLKRRGCSKAENPWSDGIGSGSELRQGRAKVAKACCTELRDNTPTCPSRINSTGPTLRRCVSSGGFHGRSSAAVCCRRLSEGSDQERIGKAVCCRLRVAGETDKSVGERVRQRETLARDIDRDGTIRRPRRQSRRPWHESPLTLSGRSVPTTCGAAGLFGLCSPNVYAQSRRVFRMQSPIDVLSRQLLVAVDPMQRIQ